MRLLAWAIFGLVVVVLTTSWALDTNKARAVKISVEINPSSIPGDGRSSTTFTVYVRNSDGSPRQGDTIEVLNQVPGLFDRTRALTNEEGKAVFLFTSSKSNKYRPAAPVPVIVTNTSLGKLIEVRKTITATINVTEPSPVNETSPINETSQEGGS
jgi:hypothetical protein